MSEYLHGAYGEIGAIGSPVTVESQSAFVVVGAAPVGQVANYAGSVNRPIAVRNMAEARKYFGYSSDWAKYPLCEAFHVFFEQRGVGPLVVINVLDPATHKGGTAKTQSLTMQNGRAVISAAEDAILATLSLSRESTTFVKGTDYTAEYDYGKKAIIISAVGSNIGTDAFTATWYEMNPTAVTSANVIGTSDGLGTNTGLQAVKDIYSLTGMVPCFLLCPGTSSVTAVHTAMREISQKVNGHWDLYMYADLPLTDGTTPLTLDTVAAYKAANGYNRDNEKVFFPMALGTDGKHYHLSVLAAAALLQVTIENDDIPYHSSSNIPCPIIENLYLGENFTGRVYDDQMINEKLNQNGICSAAFVSRRWAIWGAHSANYNASEADSFSVAETNCLMLYYLSNDFQARRAGDVDQPMTVNDVETIAAEEQARLDALKQIGALTYGVVSRDASADLRSDIINGDHVFTFEITTTPLARSLKAKVNWVETGFETYFETGAEEEA